MNIIKKLKLLHYSQLQQICNKLKIKYNKKDNKKKLIIYLLQPLKIKYKMENKKKIWNKISELPEDVEEIIVNLYPHLDSDQALIRFGELPKKLQKKILSDYTGLRKTSVSKIQALRRGRDIRKNIHVRKLIKNLIRPEGQRNNELYNMELDTNNEIKNNIAGGVLNNLDLSGTNFSFTEPIGTNFQNSILKNSVFVACNLKKADFSGANLTESHITDSNLHGTNFSGANLTEVNFADSEINSETNFSGANLTEAVLPREIGNPIFDEHTILPNEYTFFKDIYTITVSRDGRVTRKKTGGVIGPLIDLRNKDLTDIPLKEFKNVLLFLDEGDTDIIIDNNMVAMGRFPEGFDVSEYEDYFINMDDFM